jgi:flavoprotein|tara:strand:- start:34 stop:570 length:537 start_codon:yes stop_codon:yes gene_type:complete
MTCDSKNNKKLGWVITGSGHFFEECLDIMSNLGEFDLFVSKAADEVIRMYKKKNASFPKNTRVFRDTTASSAPVGFFYKNIYHTLVIAPATSNSIAKFVAGISDNLATNIFAQAGKCKVPCIVLACDTEPEHDTKAPSKMVKVYPRKIDLENTEKLKSFESTVVVNSVSDLKKVLNKI